MKWVKAIMQFFIVLIMFGACFGLEYYTYQSQETVVQLKNNEKEQLKHLTYMSLQENKKKMQSDSQKIAYLTFDDGPSQVTERILDVLEVYDVRATFFLVGCNITESREKIVNRMVEQGHAIGVHTYSHEAEKIYGSAESYLCDLKKTQERIYEVTGENTTMIRFPWGSTNSYLKPIQDSLLPKLENHGYIYYDWNVSAEDSVGNPTKYSILNNVKKDYSRYQEPVILMHDSATSELTAEMLPDIIVMLKESGYQFATLEEMESPYQYPKN